MAIKTREELINSFNALIGDNNSDEVISFMEDITDSMADTDSLREQLKTATNKYEENDRTWRQRYKERFNEGVSREEKDEQEEVRTYRFEDLFKEEK